MILHVKCCSLIWFNLGLNVTLLCGRSQNQMMHSNVVGPIVSLISQEIDSIFLKGSWECSMGTFELLWKRKKVKFSVHGCSRNNCDSRVHPRMSGTKYKKCLGNWRNTKYQTHRWGKKNSRMPWKWNSFGMVKGGKIRISKGPIFITLFRMITMAALQFWTNQSWQFILNHHWIL